MKQEERIPVAEEYHVVRARVYADRFAAALGFDERRCAEVAIVVSELASNIVKFAGTGSITLRAVRDGPRVGLEVVAEDDGPGFDAPQAALHDGYSEGHVWQPQEPRVGRRGLGAGLGAVERLSDELFLENRPGRGARCLARTWQRDRP